MNYEALEKIIEDMVMKSLHEQIRRLPSNERAIFSLYLDGRTCLQIVNDLHGTCTLAFVNKTVGKVKEQLKLRYNAEVASRRV